MTAMADDARKLHALNSRIRDAATEGAVEDMLALIETRRQFLDALDAGTTPRSPALISALDEAAKDNSELVQRLEGALKQAQDRGKSTQQARRRYRKTQSHQ